jgi:predicted PurR-regulated permease PerM
MTTPARISYGVPILMLALAGVLRLGVPLLAVLNMALIALLFLIAIHKLEYFLNSKIIGDRIRNPVWLTLLALIIGERLMGIPGMVLAPVVLNYLRVELLKIEVPART